MRTHILTRRYVEAFKNTLAADNVLSGLQALNTYSSVLTSNKTFLAILSSPVISSDAKFKHLDSVFEAAQKFPQLLNFFKLLVRKNRVSLIADIPVVTKEMLDIEQNVVDCHIETNQPLPEDQHQKMLTLFKNWSSKEAHSIIHINKDIIGGFLVKLGNTLYDGTLNNSFEKLNHVFMNFN